MEGISRKWAVLVDDISNPLQIEGRLCSSISGGTFYTVRRKQGASDCSRMRAYDGYLSSYGIDYRNQCSSHVQSIIDEERRAITGRGERIRDTLGLVRVRCVLSKEIGVRVRTGMDRESWLDLNSLRFQKTVALRLTKPPSTNSKSWCAQSLRWVDDHFEVSQEICVAIGKLQILAVECQILKLWIELGSFKLRLNDAASESWIFTLIDDGFQSYGYSRY